MTRHDASMLMHRVFRCLGQGKTRPAVMPMAISYATLAVQRLHEARCYRQAAKIAAKIIDNKVK